MSSTPLITVLNLTSIRQCFLQITGQECDVYYNSRKATIFIIQPNDQTLYPSIAYAIAKVNQSLCDWMNSSSVNVEVKHRKSFKPTKAMLKSALPPVVEVV